MPPPIKTTSTTSGRASGSHATLTVHGLTRFDSSTIPEIDRPEPGNMLLVADVTITNIDMPAFPVDINTVELVDAGGVRASASLSADVDLMTAGSLLPGQSRRGNYVFDTLDNPGMTYHAKLYFYDNDEYIRYMVDRVTGLSP
ncbi:MAG: DUF4352 domain-containing protein [Methanospirillum sp.]|nr:DUF4352 domain-containing protein [Methanospirillum sp.]